MAATATKTRPNTYAGQCSGCDKHVAAQAGVLGAKVNGRWTVRHNDCTAWVTKADCATAERSYGRAYRPSTSNRCSECGNSGTCFGCRHDND